MFAGYRVLEEKEGPLGPQVLQCLDCGAVIHAPAEAFGKAKWYNGTTITVVSQRKLNHVCDHSKRAENLSEAATYCGCHTDPDNFHIKVLCPRHRNRPGYE